MRLTPPQGLASGGVREGGELLAAAGLHTAVITAAILGILVRAGSEGVGRLSCGGNSEKAVPCSITVH